MKIPVVFGCRRSYWFHFVTWRGWLVILLCPPLAIPIWLNARREAKFINSVR